VEVIPKSRLASLRPRHLDGEAPVHHDAFCDTGFRVASTLLLPHLRQRRRLTKAAIGVFGAIAKRASTSGAKTLKWPHRRH
jgi:hypothetical protein